MRSPKVVHHPSKYLVSQTGLQQMRQTFGNLPDGTEVDTESTTEVGTETTTEVGTASTTEVDTESTTDVRTSVQGRAREVFDPTSSSTCQKDRKYGRKGRNRKLLWISQYFPHLVHTVLHFRPPAPRPAPQDHDSGPAPSPVVKTGNPAEKIGTWGCVILTHVEILGNAPWKCVILTTSTKYEVLKY